MTHEQKKQCKKIFNNYGEEHQLNKLTEELGELIQAIAKYRSEPTEENRKHFAEEMADVLIMLQQLMPVAGEELVNDYVQQKLNRQLRRIKNET